MTIQELIHKHSFSVFHLAQPERIVSGCYCGDLLSWVMGRAGAGSLWLTIMSNGNVAAVASLTDVAGVLLTEGVTPDADLLSKARTHGINLLGCDVGTYEAVLQLSDIQETPR